MIRSIRAAPAAVLSAALVLLLSTPADAQTLKGGLSLADIFGGDVQASETRNGLSAGGAMTLLRLGPFSVGPEIYYAQKGADAARLMVEGPESFSEFGLDYLEVPVLGRVTVTVPNARFLQVYAQGGPAFAWNLDCNIRRSEGGTAVLNDECDLGRYEDGRAVVDAADRGVVMGGGANIQVLDYGSINLDARMVRGLARLAEGADGPDVRNRAVSLMAGYSFGF